MWPWLLSTQKLFYVEISTAAFLERIEESSEARGVTQAQFF